MPVMVDALQNIVPISDFSHGKASGIFDRAHESSPVVVMKNNTPFAVITSPAEYERLTSVEDDYELLLEALERLDKDEGAHKTLDEIMKEVGITRAELDSTPEIEFE